MNRRHFIRGMAAGGLSLLSYKCGNFLQAAESPSRKLLVHLSLDGGPDFRHLLPPEFNTDRSSHAWHFWNSRRQSFGISDSQSAMQNLWNTYTRIENGGQPFGIHPLAGWFSREYQAGRIAIVNNVFASQSRDHSHATNISESGDHQAKHHEHARSGWGGRLAQMSGGHVAALTSKVRMFCNGPHATNPILHNNNRVIHMHDSRRFALYVPDSLKDNAASRHPQAIMARSLRSYFEAKREQVVSSSPHHRYFQHERKLRDWGALIQNELQDHPVPADLTDLMEGQSALNNRSFARQCRNLYDSVACSDILNLKAMSMDYGGFDTHRDQNSNINGQFEDIFGTGRGLDQALKHIRTDFPEKYENMVLVISGEFGRQLAANGDGGTDHGRGNSLILWGPQIRGGIYGEMFPASEVANFNKPGADIKGRTSVQLIQRRLCSWLAPGLGESVVPKSSEEIQEIGIGLSMLMQNV